MSSTVANCKLCGLSINQAEFLISSLSQNNTIR